MPVTLLDAEHDQCRTPLWAGPVPPVDQQFVCGAPTVTGKTFCPACRLRLYLPRKEANRGQR